MENYTSLKTPPHSAEAERGILGAILLDAQAGDSSRVFDLCQSAGIVPDSFFDPQNRLLFTTMVEMSAESVQLDSITLMNRLRASGRLEATGGFAKLQQLIDFTPSAAHAEYYIDIVRQKYQLRRLITCSQRITEACFDETRSGNADILLGEAEKDILEVGGKASVRTDWKVAVDATLSRIENIFDRGAGTFDGLSTGFKYIDEKLMGLKPAEMIVIAARPSVGKTSFAMNIAECVATGTNIEGIPTKADNGKKHPVLVFSLEMDTLSLANRMMCGRAHVSSWRISRSLMSRDEKQSASASLFKAASELKAAPIFIDDASGLDIADLRARARRMKKQHGIELIVIDYLQLCNCREAAKQGRQLETSRISGQIKTMAKELQIPVIVLSQLSRANEQRGDKYEKPKLSDLRDSGAIEQDADIVMLLRRPQMIQAQKDNEELKNIAFVDVAKHRNGETGEVKMRFNGEWTRFGDLEPEKKDSSGGGIDSMGEDAIKEGASTYDAAANAVDDSAFAQQLDMEFSSDAIP